MTNRPTVRCAIYTRVSSDERLEQEFNSLEAQREACEAYIKSQRNQGWRVIGEGFDDGGHSGGTIERPALQRLLEKVRERRIDIIIIYKIDRLTRSLTDFARLAELFDTHGISFVAVTQPFNTTTSMGRLMLNVLLSFAQFEREVTSERIRDKIAASKKKGLWMGGNVPLGYDVQDRALVINTAEAETVRTLYQLYRKYRNVRAVVAEADRLGLRTKLRVGPTGRRSGGGRFQAGHVYHVLKSPVYTGRIPHKNKVYPGSHEPIIDPQTWEAVQQQIATNRNGEHCRSGAKDSSPLAGLLVDAQGNRFTPSHAVKSGRRYRYYIDRALITGHRQGSAKPRRLPAREIEDVVRRAIDDLLGSPVRLVEALGGEPGAAKIEHAIQQAERLRKELSDAAPALWAAHLRTLLGQVIIDQDHVRLRIQRSGLRAALHLPNETAHGSTVHTEGTERDLFDAVVNVRIRMRGNQVKLAIGDGSVPRERDTALVKTVFRAHEWFERLKNGDAQSVRDIARTEGLTGSYVTRVLRLAFLAPDIVEAILNGRQPVELTADRLLLREDLPLNWREQRQRLGIDDK